MRSRQSSFRRWIGSIGVWLSTLLCLGSMVAAGTALAENPEQAKDFWEALTKGTPVLDMRGRVELAEVGTFNWSQSYTLRTRLGYATKPWYYTQFHMDFENVTGVATGDYWNGVEPNTRNRSLVADPTATQVNQAFARIQNEDWADMNLVGGRQRIIFDDARFIGNVGWRQNEQTYDAVLGSTDAMLDDFQLLYSYVGEVHRIFGDQDYKFGAANAGNTFDWHSKSHLIHSSFTRWSAVKPVFFVYLLELSNPRGTPGVQTGVARQSTASYGFRLPGKWDLGENWTLDYVGSYAYQTQYQNNPSTYGAHYALVDLKLTWKRLGALGGGWEMLGSANGFEQVKTPLATAHKHNGWADVFIGINNGGRNGLTDLYANLSPKLPWDLKMLLVYHHFRNANGGYTLGNEFDARLTRNFTRHLQLLFKAAYFKAANGATASGPTGPVPVPDVWRMDFDVTLKI